MPDDPIGLAERLQNLFSNGWGAFSISILVIVYLFHQLRASEAARLADSENDRKALQEQNKVLQRVAEVVAQLGNKAAPPGVP